jgi:hypothetical protein
MMISLFVAIIAAMTLLLSCSRGRCAAASPEERIREFYSWYLRAPDEGLNPGDDSRMYDYVAPATMEQYRRDLDDGVLDYDYFTNSQDPDPAWADTMSVGQAVDLDDGSCMVAVTMDKAAQGAPRLAVFLRKEGDALHIAKVDGLTA